MSVEAALREAKIRELRPSQPVCVSPTTTLAQAIGFMRERRAGCVLVCDQDRVVGILTERDILNKIIGESIPLDSSVNEYMTRDPRTLTADDVLSDAVRLMDQGDYRHLPLVDKAGRVEGIISIQHVIGFLAQLFPEEVMNLPPRSDQYLDSREGG